MAKRKGKDVSGVSEKRDGFFYVGQINGVWWFFDPNGQPFISKGINHISFQGDYCPALGYAPYHRNVLAKYGDEEIWAKATVHRLRSWGFNTVGAWSSPSLFRHLPYTIILNWVNMEDPAADDWIKGSFPDVFAPEFHMKLIEIAERECAPRRYDPLLLGYFTDNELHWGPDWRSPRHLLEEYLVTLPPEAQGKRKAVEFLRKRYGEINQFNMAWGLALSSWKELEGVTELPLASQSEKGQRLQDCLDFLRLVADEYFRTWHEAIRAYDHRHLILGCRFAGLHPPRPVVEAMAPFVDVVSVQWYGFTSDLPVETLNDLHEITGRPFLLSEFSFIAIDSGLPNKKKAIKPVPTQRDRAEQFEQLVTRFMRLPYSVGYHWFEWSDDPVHGDYFGEDCNYGVVKENDEPWDVLVQRMSEVNRRIEVVHAKGK